MHVNLLFSHSHEDKSNNVAEVWRGSQWVEEWKERKNIREGK